MKNWLTTYFALSFALIIGGGFLAQVTHYDFKPDLSENRNKKPIPSLHLNWGSIKNYPADFEACFNDQFGMRNTLIYLNSLFRNVLMRASTSKLVVFGKNGWLFYTGNSSMDFARNSNAFSDAELLEISSLLRSRKAWFENRKIVYVMIIPPNSQSIYSEFLPDYYTQKVGPVSRLDQVVEVARKIGFPLIDLRADLLQKKATAQLPLYRKTDTHWSDEGAYLGYVKLIETLSHLTKIQGSSPELGMALEKSQLVESKLNGTGGDLAGMLGLRNLLHEERITLKNPRVEKCVETERNGLNFTTVCPSNSAPLEAVIFRDSFFDALQPFVSPHFQMARYISSDLSINTVENFKPQVVIEEFVERFLSVEKLQKQKAELGQVY